MGGASCSCSLVLQVEESVVQPVPSSEHLPGSWVWERRDVAQPSPPHNATLSRPLLCWAARTPFSPSRSKPAGGRPHPHVTDEKSKAGGGRGASGDRLSHLSVRAGLEPAAA